MLLALAINHNFVLGALFFAVITFAIAMFIMSDHGHGHYAHPYNNYYRPIGSTLTQPISFELVEKIVHEILQRVKYTEHEYEHLNRLTTNKKTTAELIRSTQNKLKDERIALQRQQEKLQQPGSPDAQRMTVQHVHVFLYDQNIRLENIKRDIEKIIQALKEETKEPEERTENEFTSPDVEKSIRRIESDSKRIDDAINQTTAKIETAEEVSKKYKKEKYIRLLLTIGDQIEEILTNLELDRKVMENVIQTIEKVSQNAKRDKQTRQEIIDELLQKSKTAMAYKEEDYPQKMKRVNKLITTFQILTAKEADQMELQTQHIILQKITKWKRRIKDLAEFF